MQSKKWPATLLLAIFSLSILYIGFLVERTDFTSLIFSFLISFSGYLYLSKIFYQHDIFAFKIKHLIYLGIALRLVLCFSFPHLSDDIFRFYWDGKLIAHGYNPFSHLPTYFIDNQIFTNEKDIYIFQHLNSPNYFSVYPPVCQVVFFLAYKMSFENIFIAAILMKLFLFACEIGTIFLIKKMSSEQNALLYALNPLCIIEICGNLHFEGAMIFFFVAVLFFLNFVLKKSTAKLETTISFVYPDPKGSKRNSRFKLFRFSSLLKNNSLLATKLFAVHYSLLIVICSLLLALSVCSKLLTLMFLPILAWELVARTLVRESSRTKVHATNQYFQIVKSPNHQIIKSLIFPILTLLFIALLFYPLISDTFVANFSKSINLYFQKFEFNASFYYILKKITTLYYGFHPIERVSGFLSIIVLTSVVYLTFAKKALYDKLFWLFFVYLLCQSTVHPWYLTTLVALSILANKKTGILWSGLVFLSYSHYAGGIYKENFTLIILEYGILALYCSSDFSRNNSVPKAI